MHSNNALVSLVGLLPHGISNRVREPAGQILPNSHGPGVERQAALPVSESLRELRCDLLTSLAIQRPALASLRGVHGVLGTPAATLAPADAPLAISPLAHA